MRKTFLVSFVVTFVLLGRAVLSASPLAATGLTVTNITGTGMSVSWTGTSPEFRAIYKAGSVPISPTDGILIFEGAGTSADVTGLAVNTRYFVAAYGKESGAATYSTTAATTSVITAPTALVTSLGSLNGPWDRRASPTRQGKFIFGDSTGNLDLFDGTSVITIQPKGAFGTNPNTVFALGTAADPAHLIAAWRRTDAYVSTDSGTPFTINAANPVSPGTPMDAEVITVDGGCVFAVYRAVDPGTNKDRRNAFFVDPSSGNTTDLTNNTTVYGVGHMSSSGCKAAWAFDISPDNTGPNELQYYNGSTVTTLDGNIIGDPSISQGRIVYAKHVAAGNNEIFLYDTNPPSPSPVQLTNVATKNNETPYTDGRHAAWVRRNLDTTGPEIMLNGGLQLTTGNFALLDNTAAPSFDLDRGQILWRDTAGVMHHETSSSSTVVDTGGSATTSIPWLADGRVVFFDVTTSPENVYRFTGQFPNDSLQPVAPMFLRATPGSGSVTLGWDAILGATSYNVYYAARPGLTKANYASLGGVRITGVTSSSYTVSGLAPNAPYYFVITTVDPTGEGPESRQASAVVIGTPNWTSVGSLSATAMFAAAADRTSPNAAYASGSNNNTYASTDGGSTWSVLAGGIAGVTVHGLAANGGTVFATSTNGSIYRSTSGGASWSAIVSATSNSFNQSIAIDPAVPSTILAGDFRLPSFTGGANDSDVIRSDDNGATWFHTPQFTPSGSLVGYSLVFDPSHTSTLFLGGNGTPNVAKSLAGGAGWVDTGLPVSGSSSGYVYTVAVDAQNPQTIYAGVQQSFGAFSPGVWKSTNGGTTWTQINTGLPSSTAKVNAIVVDPADSNVLHIGTETGYYYSTNAGASWTLANTGLPNLNAQFIYSLAMTGSHRLIAGTGDGLYLLNLSAAPAPTVSSVNPATGNVAGGTSVTITGTNFQSGATVTFGVVAATNVAFVNSATITATTPAHAAGAVDVVVHNPDGQTGTKTSGFTYSTALAAPANVVAAASSTTQVNITWNAVVGATSYQLYRRSPTTGGAFALVNSPTTNAYADTGVTAGNSYFYIVRAVNESTSSPDSTPDLATTILFTDDPIVAGSTVVKAVHLGEIRNAANAVRALAGLAPASFSGAASAGTTITAAQINEVRTALDGGRSPLGLPTGGYTDTLTAGVPIKAVHFQEIRNRTK
jgi:hypothetical protein